MTKREVREMMCKIASHVGAKVYDHARAHDCFCQREKSPNFSFDPEILTYIFNAVNEKIEREYIDTTPWTED